MRLDRVAFWHGGASEFFDKKRPGASPRSAVQQQYTEQITHYLKALR